MQRGATPPVPERWQESAPGANFVVLAFSFIASLVAAALIPVVASAAAPEPVYGTNAMVVSRSSLASEAGLKVMREGGNAIDGAVATAFTLAVTYPSAGNIGGGGFAVVRLADGKVVTLDHRERAPAAASRDMYLDGDGNVIPGLSTSSHQAAGVPGSVDGLLLLLETYGTRSRREVMAPALRHARRGFALTPGLARQFEGVLPRMKDHPASVAKFSKDGKPYKAGDTWRQPDLARTLTRIARDGRDGFYKGPVADRIVAEMKRGGGVVNHADLVSYASVWRDPVVGNYRGYTIYGMGPPSSGGAMIVQMLNMIEPYDVKAMGYGSADAVQLMVEAERRAYADRSQHLGDPDFYDVPLATLTSKAYARLRFADFDPAQASVSDEIGAGPAAPAESLETTHFSVMDKTGMMVALTTTINSGYGNKIVVEGAGFLLNNEMNDFSIKPNTPNQYQLLGREANAIAPDKRMLSSMSPTLVVRDGEPVLVTGSPGGSTIITTTFQVLVNVIDHGMGIDNAVSVPRFHHQWKPDNISHESYAFSPETIKVLNERGYRSFRERSSWRGFSDANSIHVVDGQMQGMKDPRNDGSAAGF